MDSQQSSWGRHDFLDLSLHEPGIVADTRLEDLASDAAAVDHEDTLAMQLHRVQAHARSRQQAAFICMLGYQLPEGTKDVVAEVFNRKIELDLVGHLGSPAMYLQRQGDRHLLALCGSDVDMARIQLQSLLQLSASRVGNVLGVGQADGRSGFAPLREDDPGGQQALNSAKLAYDLGGFHPVGHIEFIDV
ncbi:MAG: hypothetical protein M0Q42_03180 [Xanthomonadales bacterium]|nr:hypothetical protein [Xanthomonadales bacterium]